MNISPVRLLVPMLVVAAIVAPAAPAAESKSSTRVKKLLRDADKPFRELDGLVVVDMKTPTGTRQPVFITTEAQVYGDVEFIEVTSIGWTWEDAQEFSRSNANWLLKDSTNRKIGAWQALVFEDSGNIAAEFKVTVPLSTTAETLGAIVDGVGMTAYELRDIMDE